MQINALVFNCHASGCNIRTIALASATVELPGMPRTNDHMIMQSAMSKRSTSVRAYAFGGVELAVNVADQIDMTKRGNFGHTAGRQLRNVADAFLHCPDAFTMGMIV
jgi:hypothetical protein